MSLSLFLSLAAVFASLGVALWVAKRTPQDTGLVDELKRREQEAQAEMARIRQDLENARRAETGARAEAAQTLIRLEEERALLAQAEKTFKEAFESLASKALSAGAEEFHRMAERSLTNATLALDQKSELRNAQVDTMIRPLKEQLDAMRRFSEGIKEGEGNIRAVLERLSAETGQLSDALKNNQARGALGEFILERMVQWAGLQKGVHYDVQVHAKDDEDRRYKPDLILHLPGERDIIVDSKAVLDAYVAAGEEKDPARREALLKQHAEQLRGTATMLASKRYQDQFARSPDFVVLFLPTEGLLQAASERDPKLFEDAFQKKVVLCTPSGFMAMIKVVERSWKETVMADNAKAIVAQGQLLMDRLVKFMEHLADLGRELDKSVKSYNEAYGSLRRNLYPAVRDLKALGVEPTRPGKKESMPKTIESTPRFKEAEIGELKGLLAGADAESSADAEAI